MPPGGPVLLPDQYDYDELLLETKKLGAAVGVLTFGRVAPRTARPILRYGFGVEIGAAGEIAGLTPLFPTNLAPFPFGFSESSLYGVKPNYYLPKGSSKYLPDFIPGVKEQNLEDRPPQPRVAWKSPLFTTETPVDPIPDQQVWTAMPLPKFGTYGIGNLLASRSSATKIVEEIYAGGAPLELRGQLLYYERYLRAINAQLEARGYFAPDPRAVLPQPIPQPFNPTPGAGPVLPPNPQGAGGPVVPGTVPGGPSIPVLPDYPGQPGYLPRRPPRPRPPVDPIAGGGVIPFKKPVAN